MQSNVNLFAVRKKVKEVAGIFNKTYYFKDVKQK